MTEDVQLAILILAAAALAVGIVGPILYKTRRRK